ncbi:MAG: cytochrome P450 [Pirellulales bacterium]
MLTHDETPTHRRDKSVMSAMLPMSDTAMIREKIGGFASKAILKASGRIEVVNEFARLVPLQLVQDYFGLDGVDIGELKRWSYWAQFDNFHNHHFHERENAMEISQRAGEAKQQLAAYATALVQRRTGELRRDPNRDDIVSRMLKSKFPPSVGFGLDRVVANAMGLLIGAVETTSHAIVHAIDELLSRPKELAAAVQSAAEGDFETLSEYVWEANRFRPISPFMFRYCEQDFTIAKGTERETEIPTGVTVFTLTQSAMFDPVEFDNPTEFRADRPKYQSFLFGFGHHRCLGEYVGREMIPEAIKALVVCKNLRRADGPAGHIDFKDGPFPESLTLTYDQ